MARWALLTGETAARRFQEETGISTNTIAKTPGHVRGDKRVKLAMVLRFASWRDLESAMSAWDVGRGITVTLDATAYRTAVREAGGKDVGAWVSKVVEEAAGAAQPKSKGR